MTKTFYFITFIYLLLIILFFILVILFMLPPAIGDLSGDTGIRKMNDNCFGIKAKESDVIKRFNPGDSEKTILFTNFVYHVPAEQKTAYGQDPLYCIGINIWHNP